MNNQMILIVFYNRWNNLNRANHNTTPTIQVNLYRVLYLRNGQFRPQHVSVCSGFLFVFIYVKMMYHVSFSTIGVIVKILGYPLKINTWRWFNCVNLVGLCKPATSFCIVRIVCGCTKMVSLRWQYQFPSSLWLVSLSWLTVFHARLSSTAHFYD